LRTAGLVAVAIVSGLVWFYVTIDTSTPANTGGESTNQQPGGVYQFTPHEDMPHPNKVSNCAAHAYGDIETFLKNTKCDHLARQLFVTKLDDGRTVYTSVSVITMQNEADAAELRDFTDKDGSGNINDVVRDGLVKIEGIGKLSRADGYKSQQSGQDVIIVEADFAPKDQGTKKGDQGVLDDVCDDALRLSQDVNSGGTGSG
jgi:hypothetical protein